MTSLANNQGEQANDESAAQDKAMVATVNGERLDALPEDLYIPPEALRVFLETFEGPLDLLLYLIKKQNLDVLNIPIAEITKQYTQYIDMMTVLRIELAAEYLLMAALLAEIKSRMLLPRQSNVEDIEDDPRAELVRRLQAYEQFKQAADDLDKLPRIERDFFEPRLELPQWSIERQLPAVSLDELLKAMKSVLSRAEVVEHHHIQREALSVREKMSSVLSVLKTKEHIVFIELFDVNEGRQGVVVTFLAVLELCKERLVEIVQQNLFAPIHVRAMS